MANANLKSIMEANDGILRRRHRKFLDTIDVLTLVFDLAENYQRRVMIPMRSANAKQEANVQLCLYCYANSFAGGTGLPLDHKRDRALTLITRMHREHATYSLTGQQMRDILASVIAVKPTTENATRECRDCRRMFRQTNQWRYDHE